MKLWPRLLSSEKNWSEQGVYETSIRWLIYHTKINSDTVSTQFQLIIQSMTLEGGKKAKDAILQITPRFSEQLN